MAECPHAGWMRTPTPMPCPWCALVLAKKQIRKLERIVAASEDRRYAWADDVGRQVLLRSMPLSLLLRTAADAIDDDHLVDDAALVRELEARASRIAYESGGGRGERFDR